MTVIRDELIWITGASSGIGRELALSLAAAGNRVIASARNREALHALAARQQGITPLICDVSDRDSLCLSGPQLAEIGGSLDRLIINAGNCEYLDIDKPDWSMMNRSMAVNFFGAINTLELALPLLKKSRHPHIVGIASQATFIPFARAEAYGASKAALQYFLNALRIDLIKNGIDVTVINPGFVKTPLTDKNDFAMPFLLSSEEASQRILAAIAKRPYQYDFPKRLAWLLRLFALMPKTWTEKISPQLNKTTKTGSTT